MTTRIAACWARFSIQVSFEPDMVFRSTYDEPVYFTGAVRTDVSTNLATAVAAPLSDTTARVVKFRVAPGCPVEEPSDSSGVTLLIGSLGGWAGGYIQEDVLQTVLFARHEVSAVDINLAAATSVTKTVCAVCGSEPRFCLLPT